MAQCVSSATIALEWATRAKLARQWDSAPHDIGMGRSARAFKGPVPSSERANRGSASMGWNAMCVAWVLGGDETYQVRAVRMPAKMASATLRGGSRRAARRYMHCLHGTPET